MTFSCTKCICMNSRQGKKIAKLSVEGEKKKTHGANITLYTVYEYIFSVLNADAYEITKLAYPHTGGV